MKNKETIEEAARNIYGEDEDGYYSQKKSFINGAKWQAERMYSEEEVLDIIHKFDIDEPFDQKEWFEQFKKK